MAVVNSNRFNLKEAVDYIIDRYYLDVQEAMTEAMDEVSKEAVQKLKKSSPTRDKGAGGGKYAKGWKRQKDKGRMRVGYTIYNETPGLPHLLEKSHALRNGLRSTPQVHIKPVEEWAVEEVFERFYDKVEGI